MYATVEVRWFYPGDVPTAVFDWFNTIDTGFITEPARTDYYLQPLTCDGMGIKLREGRIECKQRIQTVQSLQFSKQIKGVIELWQKWSFLISEENELSETFQASQWVAVEKSRQIQIFQLEPGQGRQAQNPEEPMVVDCSIELTALHVKNEKWWTLGLESYGGDETAVLLKLLPAMKWAFSSQHAPQLDSQASFGYPQWLLSIM